MGVLYTSAANLIVEAMPQERVSECTGMMAVMTAYSLPKSIEKNTVAG